MTLVRPRTTRRSRPSLVILMALLMLVGSGPAVAAQDTGTGGGRPPLVMATVTGAEAINIRECPEITCEAISVAELGDTVEVTGEPEDGFTPVRHGGRDGYAYDLFLGREGLPVPRFVEGAPGCDRIALAFNVGQGFEPSVGILDILEREEVDATFFVMGWWAEENPELVERMVELGFEVGSHGDQAIALTNRTDAEVVADIEDAAARIRAIIGDDLGPAFTPYAAAIDDRVRSLVASTGYLPVGWQITSDDWDYDATAEAVWDNVVPNAYDGAIVELHFDGPATEESTQTALPWIIDGLGQRGYKFVTISDMMLPCGAADALEAAAEADAEAASEAASGSPTPSPAKDDRPKS
ncbi:MAG: polysaccharide deacetylase family protein [Chloroflexota bacterium]|nr:polysaccharide deacetylase family protein [Chloroflexota bacterium]